MFVEACFVGVECGNVLSELVPSSPINMTFRSRFAANGSWQNNKNRKEKDHHLGVEMYWLVAAVMEHDRMNNYCG